MSRLDAAVAEENRKAHIRQTNAAERAEKITGFLKANPAVGELNGGKYYRLDENAKPVYIDIEREL